MLLAAVRFDKSILILRSNQEIRPFFSHTAACFHSWKHSIVVREKVSLKSKIFDSSPTTEFGKFMTVTTVQSAGGKMNRGEFNFGEIDTGIQSRATILAQVLLWSHHRCKIICNHPFFETVICTARL